MADKCVWLIEGVECDGEVKNQELFSCQVQIPVCAAHMRIHKMVMFIGSSGADIGDTLSMTTEQLEQKVAELIATGLDFDNFNEL